MKKLTPALLVGVAALLLASGALASHSIQTTIVFDSGSALSENPSQEFLAGHLDSPSHKCLKNRTVKITGIYGAGGGPTTTHPFDTAKTGKNGGFSGIGPSTSGGDEIEAARLKLAPKSIGTRQHPKTCSGYSELTG